MLPKSFSTTFEESVVLVDLVMYESPEPIIVRTDLSPFVTREVSIPNDFRVSRNEPRVSPVET